MPDPVRPTDDQLVTLARDHYAAHPGATPLDVLAMARLVLDGTQ